MAHRRTKYSALRLQQAKPMNDERYMIFIQMVGIRTGTSTAYIENQISRYAAGLG